MRSALACGAGQPSVLQYHCFRLIYYDAKGGHAFILLMEVYEVSNS